MKGFPLGTQLKAAHRLSSSTVNQRKRSCMPLSKEAVKDKMKDANTIVLNVLSESEYAKIHITGSENLPLGEVPADFVQAVEKKYGKEKFVITYCAGVTCDAGPKAAKALQEKGF